MDSFVRRFVKSSLVWLCVGAVIGLAMGVIPSWAIYRPAHLHTMLLGFVTMMIYGVAYHVLPRFAGRPLYSRKLADIHWWTSNPGLAAMVIGFGLRVSSEGLASAGTVVLSIGGLLSTFGAFAFAWNIWRTVQASAVVIIRPRNDQALRKADLPVRSG